MCAIFLVAACAPQADSGAAQLPETAEPASGDADILPEQPAGRCGEARICGDLSYVDCGSAMDGPSYFYKTDTREIVMRCGGTCMMQAKDIRPGYCSECPPKEWTCEAVY